MLTLIIILHVIASVILILVVLLQSGKAGDIASAFGGMSSQTAFGARGAATFLSKATTVSAIIFMLTSLGLSILLSRTSGGTLMERLPDQGQPPQSAPQTPGQLPPQQPPPQK